MARRGAPLKLTPRLAKQIVEDVRLGLHFELAAKRAGIDSSTLRRWRERGRAARRGILARFARDVEKADGEAMRSCVICVRSAAQKEWTAAAWLLERRQPEFYGRKDRSQIEHSGPGGGPISVDDRNRSRSAVAAALAAHPEARAAVVAALKGLSNENGSHAHAPANGSSGAGHVASESGSTVNNGDGGHPS